MKYKKLQNGGDIWFENFKKTLPDNLRKSGKEYDMKTYWKNSGKPFSFTTAKSIFPEVQDTPAPIGFPFHYHANTVSYNKETGNYDFSKAKTHPTIKYEMEWYNSPEGKEFKKEYRIKEDPDRKGFNQYVKRFTPEIFKKGGKTKHDLHIIAEAPKEWYQSENAPMFSKTFVNDVKYENIYNKAISIPRLKSIIYSNQNIDFNPKDILRFKPQQRNHNLNFDYRYMNKELNSLPETETLKINKTFTNEAEKLKQYQQKYKNVNITPLYDNVAKLDSVIKSIKPGDDIAILGHSGDLVAGLSPEQVNKSLGNIKTNCYVGSCHGGDKFGEGLNINGYKFRTIKDKWYGVNPNNNSSFENLFFSGGSDNVSDIIKNAINKHKKGGWIQKAVNPAHKGYCTPMTKPTCTPRRKALAKRFKSGEFKHQNGGIINYDISNILSIWKK